HPQLTGLVLWSIGHLMANGDNRSIILFSSLGVWAIIEMILISRREGVWGKPEPVSAKNDVITVIGGCVLYAVLLMAHPYLTGIILI
ncbi:MAG: putative membrane protein, partial [Gammaproteobacteria bacterium]